jgi:hypothetical protein
MRAFAAGSARAGSRRGSRPLLACTRTERDAACVRSAQLQKYPRVTNQKNAGEPSMFIDGMFIDGIIIGPPTTTVFVWLSDDTGIPAQAAIHYARPGEQDQTLLAPLGPIGIQKYRSFAKTVAIETDEPVRLLVLDKGSQHVFHNEFIGPEDREIEHFDRSSQSKHEGV